MCDIVVRAGTCSLVASDMRAKIMNNKSQGLVEEKIWQEISFSLGLVRSTVFENAVLTENEFVMETLHLTSFEKPVQRCLNAVI